MTDNLIAELRNRLLAKSDRSGECWNWTCRRNHKGYGRVRFGGKENMAHRKSYEAHVGPIPPGVYVLHRCDNRACINPAHLFLGTAQDNSTDMVNKGRDMRGEKAHHARLTEAQVIKIKRLIVESEGRPATSIARRYGIDPAAISKIRHGQAWKHVPFPPALNQQPTEGV